MKSNIKQPCLRCGACCKTSLFAYVVASDMDRWKKEGRKDVLEFIEKSSPVWAGDRLVSSNSGRSLIGCPFFKWRGRHGECGIYETRPRACRQYKPGANEMCPQFAG